MVPCSAPPVATAPPRRPFKLVAHILQILFVMLVIVVLLSEI